MRKWESSELHGQKARESITTLGKGPESAETTDTIRLGRDLMVVTQEGWQVAGKGRKT